MFLDLSSDRYFCLGEKAELHFRRLAAGENLLTQDETALAELVASGLLEEAEGGDRPRPCIPLPLPERSLLDREGTAGALAVGAALVRLGSVSAALRLRPLRAVVAGLRRRKARQQALPRASGVLDEVATAFRRSALLAAPLDQCLPRSIAAAHHLVARGVPADLVFGVRLDPFSAHCWVQAEGWLVNERVDRARNFSPILVI